MPKGTPRRPEALRALAEALAGLRACTPAAVRLTFSGIEPIRDDESGVTDDAETSPHP